MKAGWPLVGRDEELRLVSTAIAPGEGGVVIAGAAGVGKTRLAREAVALARRRGRRCRWLVATVSARSVPLGAFAEFAGDFGTDPLRRVLDVIDRLVDDQPPGTVIGIDDAHLLDEQSALVVQQLVQRRAATVILTHRSGEVAPDAIASLWKDERLPRMDLQPLSAEEVAALLARVLGGEVESLTAQRFWRYTHGNVLYLRQLVTDEADAGRLVRRAHVWVWDGNPDISPTLIELIEATIGRQPAPVIEVLDIVSLAEPVELPVLLSLASEDAVDTAQVQGLIRVDAESQTVRLAHPMFGDARRIRAGPVHRHMLQRRLAETISRLCAPSLTQSVRRAVLMLEAGNDRDPGTLREGAHAALQLLDLNLAVRLARSAVEAGGGRAAELEHAVALAIAAQGDQCEARFSDLAATATEDIERAQIVLMRAGNLAFNMYDPAAAERVLDEAQPAADACGLTGPCTAVRSACRASSGQPESAVTLATTVLSDPAVTGVARMLATWGLVWGLADLGRMQEFVAAAADGYAFAQVTPEASHLRFGLGMGHISGLRAAGDAAGACALAQQLQREAQDEASHAMTGLLMGLAELAAGNLDSAQRWCRASVARVQDFMDGAPASSGICGQFLAMALAMSGDVDGARRTLTEFPLSTPQEYRYWMPDHALTLAWIEAGEGVPSSAVQRLLAAADEVRSFGRPAREVLLLQTAAQFGESSVADRLTELATLVEGPRVDAAAEHAQALARRSGSRLMVASRRYEEIGDKVAAGDAAAQAAVLLRKRGRRGAGLTAAAAAHRLAHETGADTPALRACTFESPLTERQLEIVALAAEGLSNRDIAERLVLSVRTVEGHFFQASLKAGVKTRDELIALVAGQPGNRAVT